VAPISEAEFDTVNPIASQKEESAGVPWELGNKCQATYSGTVEARAQRKVNAA
jgi:hypothetical protein